MKLDIEKIRVDGGTQPRAIIDTDMVQEYAESMKQGEKFPPVVVFFDGTDYWLADGFHRRGGASLAGITKIDAEVKQGTLRDAILYSVGVNASHGLRRTNADKRRAVMRLLEDKEWGKWSDRAIAEKCAVDHVTVGRIREETTGEKHQSTERKGRDGRIINTTNIGRVPRPIVEESPEEEDEPEEQEVLPEVNRTIEMAIGYMNILFEDYPNLVDKHFICNSVLKFLKQKSIEFNTES